MPGAPAAGHSQEPFAEEIIISRSSLPTLDLPAAPVYFTTTLGANGSAPHGLFAAGRLAEAGKRLPTIGAFLPRHDEGKDQAPKTAGNPADDRTGHPGFHRRPPTFSYLLPIFCKPGYFLLEQQHS
jgi:hypothetical protein